MDNSDCKIAANPDISGIGVRVAIYAQAALVFIIFAVAFGDMKLTEKEFKSLREVHINQLITSHALILAALVQVGVRRLSVFHTLVVLDLCWINIISILTGLAIDWVFKAPSNRGSILTGFAIDWAFKPPSNEGKEHNTRRKYHPIFLTKEHGIGYLYPIAVSIHMVFVSGLGLVVWLTLRSRLGEQPCAAITSFSVVGKAVDILNVKLCNFSIFIYSVNILPIGNIFLVSYLFWILLVLSEFLIGTLLSLFPLPNNPSGEALYTILIFVFSFITQAIFIVDIELMLHRNMSFIGEGEADWSFGQTLALCSLISPILATAKLLYLQFSDKEPKAAAETGGSNSGMKTQGAAAAKESNPEIEAQATAEIIDPIISKAGNGAAAPSGAA